ncbi:hypothetical protein P872_22360 [Rhodonellum psychrophilum GCM71 = DSM 17998]|uniref:TonB C-terminal domain-containing protein n=2 Tax=Rhodonellum TaxID=336827 RepID=U5BQI0_9BACT|nr:MULTISPECIES: energy transducer TonB [Rhodonellum]ERM80163.1 hypothetical protein P872_22360 [Rhodonellum psychrophilum GCM71 = DSM 17998]SDZ59567.1 TonB family C-terminal domain-containing protein [Rhodonellum ikkaensis]
MNYIKPLLLVFLMASSFTLFAQSRKTIHLNEHFYPISAASGLHQFTKIISVSKEGNQTERFYDLENRPFMVIQTEFDKRGETLFQKTEKYDLQGFLNYQYLVNAKENSALTTYFKASETIMSLGCEKGVCEGTFSLKGEVIGINRDVFSPIMVYSISAWNNFLSNHLNYPPAALKSKMEGVVKLGLEILEDGSLGRLEIVNPKDSPLLLQQEALRVIQIYEGGYIPGIDAEGNPVSGWFYIPIRFQIGKDVDFKIG